MAKVQHFRQRRPRQKKTQAMSCLPLEQFSREFMQLYPNARLLVPAKGRFEPRPPQDADAKIASGEWDGIVVTHSSFERIGISRDYQEMFPNPQIAEYDACSLVRCVEREQMFGSAEAEADAENVAFGFKP